MPDTPSTLVHFIVQPTAKQAWHLACTGRQWDGDGTANLGEVTCFACRNTLTFKLEQKGVGSSTPLPQRVAPPPLTPPVKLDAVMAASVELRDIVKQGLNAGTNDAEHEALTELADLFGLTYNEHTNTYI